MQRLFIQLDPSIAVSPCAHMFTFDISQMCVRGGGRGEGNMPELIHSENQTSYLIFWEELHVELADKNIGTL